MKIHELSALTGVNPETIRLYRKKGLLLPRRQDNGYYDYSAADYISLIYLRKFREYDFSLSDVRNAWYSDRTDDLIAMIDSETEALENEILHLQMEIRQLRFERMHLMESVQTGSGTVREMQSIDDKVDFYDSSFTEIMASLRDTGYAMTTPSLYIPADILNGPCTDTMIPIRTGIGTYRYYLDARSIPIPDGAVITPTGRNISQMVTLSSLHEISLLQLKPMMDHAKKNGLTFISGTTAFLTRVQMSSGTPVFHFRIRACYEKNDLHDHSRFHALK